MKMIVVLSANAGCSVTMGGIRFWIDALHDKRTPPYQPVSPDLFSAIMEHPDFTAPDLIIYTHAHGDHYSPEMTEAALRHFPKADVFTPFAVPRPFPYGKDLQFDCGGVHFHFFPLPHEGAEYSDVPLYGFTASCGGHTLLVPGDCTVGAPALSRSLEQAEEGSVLPERSVSEKRIDCAIVDFPWASLRRGQNLLRALGIRHLLVCHFPPSEEDGGRYIELTERAVRRLESIDVRLLKQPLQREVIELN